MIHKKAGEKYNHFYYDSENEKEFVLLGVNKELDNEEISIYEDESLQIYGRLTEKILELEDLQDRKVLFDAIDEVKGNGETEFHGTYWDILLDFFRLEKGVNPHQLSVELYKVVTKECFPNLFYGKTDMNKGYYREELTKNINSNLVNLKGSQGRPHKETIRLAELVCNYMGVTKEVLKTGSGTWYIFKDRKYTWQAIYEYCEKKWRAGQEVILKEMIEAITGQGSESIGELPIRIWTKERLLDKKAEQTIEVLIEQMKKKK